MSTKENKKVSRYQKLDEQGKRKVIDTYNKWVQNNPIRQRYNLAYDRAKRKGHDFDIDVEYLQELFEQQNGKCAYTKVDLTQSKSKIINMSIDRIDNSKGYTKGNVVWVSSIVNSMKNDLTEDEFIYVINLLYENIVKNSIV